MNKILAFAFGAMAFGCVGSLGWPLGMVGASGAALMAVLHYTAPEGESTFRWESVKRRPYRAFGYVAGYALLVGSAFSLLFVHS